VLEDQWYAAVGLSQTAALKAAWKCFEQHGVSPVLAPALTGEISSPMALGSDSTPVEIDFLGERTYLADSLQFGLELLCRLHPGGAWYAMPSFRGEAADQRHLNQFFHIEAEVAGELGDAMALAERLVTEIVAAVAGVLDDDAADALRARSSVFRNGVPRLEHDDAVEMLRDVPGATALLDDAFTVIAPPGEARLAEEAGGTVWILHPPREVVPFYQADDGSRALAADLVVGRWETVGAGQRHTTGSDTRAALRRSGVPESEYAQYLQMKDRRPIQTAGFGLGLERLLAWCLDHEDLRDLPLFPLVPTPVSSA